MADIFLEPPESCDECASFNIKLITNDLLYGVKKGRWPYVYYCRDCKASVGCHPNTFNPLGLMANRRTRQLRKDAHIAFDKLWNSGLMTRTSAYTWLAEQLKISFEMCHISWLSNAQLLTVIALSSAHFEQNAHIAERRKVKRNAKLIRQRDYEKQRIIRRKTKR